ncbi:MAG: 30S ribosomal protein S4 [Elusimicrobia bacterium RIFOXYC2_FULL_34_12]|nr:MAG: 30S ribosomal protein S4 [Elusimicrobia bacterium RIFOXYC2_FULL_34_12]OGS38565.1 MAG: 30S ribosomal protein S4 [Elusimicrobia bacterium RIFOXYD2_FULL_34_30]HAM38832.1 30S ribosomal protein S4 [Elusimicrobiota bacterium]
MARYIGPKCRRCRKEGIPLFLKGGKCETIKCAIAKKKGAPGPHKKLLKKPSEYSTQLRAKQQVKRIYGVMERQFRRYFGNATKHKGMTGFNLLLSLEMRLDNVVRKLGYTNSLNTARQLVLHKHIKVNDRVINIPSYEVKINDKIDIKGKMRDNLSVKKNIEEATKKGIIPWISLSVENLVGTVIRQPMREEMSVAYDSERPIEQLIVELYSK